MGRLLGRDERATYVKLLSDEVRKPSDDDFDVLPPKADEAVRRDLAERMAADLRDLTVEFPDVSTLGTKTPHGPQHYRRTIARAMADIYNPAQLDVLRRLRALVSRSRSE